MPLPRERRPRKARPRRTKASTWVELEQRLEEMEGTWCEGEILNLEGWKTIRYKETEDDVIVLASVTTEFSEACACGPTGAEFTKWGFTEPAHVRDIPVRSKRTRIYFRLRRRRCERCRKTFQQPLAGVDERHALTARLVEYVGRRSFDISRTFAGVADEVGCGELTVRKIYTARALRLETGRVIEAPRWLAIDEVYPRKNEAAHCVITDPERRRVLDLLPSNEPQALWRWLLNLNNRHNVETVTIDMWAPYRAAVRRLLPRARIVVDRYHVHNLLNVALKGVLEVVRAGMTHSEVRQHMRRETLLLKNYRRLSKEGKVDSGGKEAPSEKEVVEKWLKDVPILKTAYRLKNDFSDILQLSDRQKAEELVDPWLARVCEFVDSFRKTYQKKHGANWPDPFGNVPNTFTEWRASILNYIDHGKGRALRPTNAFAEFANKQIKKAFRTGNGYSYEVLRLKVVHGGVVAARRPPHPLDEKWTRSRRDRAARKGARGRAEANPNSNVALLEKAREDQDKTAGLIQKPEQIPGWADRFGLPPGPRSGHARGKKDPSLNGGRRPFRHNENQLKMF